MRPTHNAEVRFAVELYIKLTVLSGCAALPAKQNLNTDINMAKAEICMFMVTFTMKENCM
jgi:hypothetical protein